MGQKAKTSEQPRGNAVKDARIQANKAQRIARAARLKGQGDPDRGATRAKRRKPKQLAYADAVEMRGVE